MRSKIIIILTSIFVSCLSFSVQAIIIDFQDLEQSTNDSIGLTQRYKINGFEIFPHAGSIKISRPQDSTYTGSTALYNSSEGGQTGLIRTDGGTFDLISIDLSERRVESPSNSFASKDITFTRDGGHSQTFTIDGIFPGVETFLFDSGFTGVTSVSWRQNRYVYQFDNIQVDVANNLDQAITNFVATPAPGIVSSSSILSTTPGASSSPVTFGSTTPTVCTVTGSTVSYSKFGTCTVSADQAGDANYNAAPQILLNITVNKANQSISGLMANPATSIPSGTSTLSATASSGLTVAFASTTPSVCLVSGSTVSYVIVGACTITANQAGNANFNAAPQILLNITVNKANQNISGLLANPTTGTTNGTSTLSATASSGLVVSFGSSTPSVCSVSGNTVSYVMVGSCTVTANQAGDANYNAAPQVTLALHVNKGSQVIRNFAASPNSGVIGSRSTLSAMASSGLAVTYTSRTATLCSVTGNTVNYISTGTCRVAADQAGDLNYTAAPQVTLDISVTAAVALQPQQIPTLSQWGLMVMFLMMLSIGGVMVRRKNLD